MDKFNAMIDLAAKIGREKEWEEVAGQMDKLLETGDTQVVILGGSNSGKMKSLCASLLRNVMRWKNMNAMWS